jgi:threonine/homoserine efflux transporter RhtA
LLLATLSALCLGSAAIATRFLYTAGLSPVQISQLRVTIASAVLVATPAHLAADKPSDWLLIVTYGLLAYCLNPIGYALVLGRLPVGVALLLEYLASVLVALWLRDVHGVRAPAVMWAGAVLVLVGIGLISEVWSAFRLNTLGVAGAGCGDAGRAVPAR